jgi:aminopeptidase YwaD
VRVRVRLAFERSLGRATTLVARLRGRDASLAPLVFFAHVDEPGAVDNASGVASLVELAVAMRRSIERGDVAPPAHDTMFVLGQELESVPLLLEAMGRPPLAALVLDMVGAAPEVVGAELLVERGPDPGATRPTAPDRRSGWGGHAPTVPLAAPASSLDAYVAFAFARSEAGGPRLAHRDHAFEGGSDHVPFLEAGVPAVLVWHFPDDAYHTSRDRIERVSAERMARVGGALGAVALGLASGDASDAIELVRAVEWFAERRLHHLARAGDAEGIAAFAAHHDGVLAGLGRTGVSARERIAARHREAARCGRSMRAAR